MQLSPFHIKESVLELMHIHVERGNECAFGQCTTPIIKEVEQCPEETPSRYEVIHERNGGVWRAGAEVHGKDQIHINQKKTTRN